jgi:plasmid maintenance system antidote protein VapI
LQREIDARAWSTEDLAWRIARQQGLNKSTAITVEAHLIFIMDYDSPVTPEMATWLGTAFGTSAEVWLNLEEAYREGEENNE